MTRSTAHAFANATIAAAALGAAYLVVTTPPLRRAAGRALRWWLGASLPVYLVHEIRSAWRDTAPAAACDAGGIPR